VIDVLGYHRPDTYDELWHLFEEVEPPALICAGCTDLIPKARAGLLGPATWIDLSGLGPLRHFAVEDDRLVLGAALTHHLVATDETIRDRLPALAAACGAVGSRQIRARGTLAGNAANASPCADSVLALRALGAEAVLRSASGTRRLTLGELIAGPGQAAIERGEIIESFVVPLRNGLRSSFRKIGPRRAVSVAKVSVAASARVADGRLHDVRLVMGSVGPTQLRMTEAEALLEGEAPDDALLRRVAAAVEAAVRPIDDVRSSAAYRRTTSGVLAARAAGDLPRPRG
jgi:CO/xanthine dehydrogenase FAD-binding subunit